MVKKLNYLIKLSILLAVVLGASGFSPASQAKQSGGQPIPQITQVDTSRFPQVVVYVSIINAAGEPVPVSPNSLVLLENGQEIKPEKISGSGDVGPLTTMLVMDISGSMNDSGKLDAAKAAAKAYVTQSRPGDQIGLMAFNTQTTYAQPITKNQTALLEAIDSLKARDDTAMYDALKTSIEYLEAVQGRKAIIVMTDGLDNRSKIGPLVLLDHIGPAGLSISVIGLGDPKKPRTMLGGLDEAGMKAFAQRAGGSYGYANDADSLRNLYEMYGRALQSEYVITYNSPSQLRDGVNRAVSVTLDGKAGMAPAGGTPSSYNPGGLVPEVAEPASWGVFVVLLGFLILLLAVPWLVRLVIGFFQPKARPAPVIKKSRIKLKS